jgi:aryl-alcohol dehydrogenase-like predicted oxidoreductase
MSPADDLHSRVVLGLGLIGIGRPWPDDTCQVPGDEHVQELLALAAGLGIRFLDTAPAYGLSEERLGRAMNGVLMPWRDKLVIATKCGEEWANGVSRTDHTPAGLRRSVARSVRHLGRIDLLQLHKATPDVLADPSVLDTLVELAGQYSIDRLGVSAKDPQTCQMAVESGIFTHVQCPFDHAGQGMTEWIRASQEKVTIIVNRPLGSGRLLVTASPEQLYAKVAGVLTRGLVLTGTTNLEHLKQSVSIFNALTGKQ